MNISLKNKVIIITGSTKGIGKSLAKSFMLEGAYVVINYHKDEEQAEIICKNFDLVKHNSIIIKADIRKENEVKKLCKTVIDKYGRIDVLINNAGICNDCEIDKMSSLQWNDVINTNLTSMFNCTKSVADKMIKQKDGKIINIASLKGIIGCEEQVNYATSKAGVIGFTKSLAKELGKHNISVNAICPGYIETYLNRNNKKKQQTAQRKSVLAYEYALKDLICFTMLLCSNQINGVSGQVFNIDSRIM